MAVDPRRATQQRMIAEYGRKGIKFVTTIAIQDIVAEAIAQAAITQLSVAKTLGPVVNQEIAASRGLLLQKNTVVAERAQNAIVAKYSSRRTQGGPAGYRRNAPGKYQRDAGGKLLKALSSPEFMTITADGVLLGNKAWLDSQARQWYRLNYGVKPRAGRRPGVFNMKFFGGVTPVSLAANQPNETMLMPAGGFSKDGQFTPVGYARRNGRPYRDANSRPIKITTAGGPTKGVSAWNYLDAGLAVLARDLPLAWERHYRDVLRTSAGRARIEGQVQRNRNVTQQTAKRRVRKAALEIEASLKKQR